MSPGQVALLLAAVLLLGAGAYAAWRWPPATLVAVALAPILDRYLISLLLPTDLRTATTYFSEALLLTTSVVILLGAARSGTLSRTLNHPVSWLLAAFVAIAGISALANAVPPSIALTGIVFTIEAAALFVLARAAAFDERTALAAVMAFVAVVALAALLAMGQVLLHPNLLGLETFTGRFGEGARVAAFLVSPNMLGTVLAMALPFAVLAALQYDGARRTAAAGLSLLLSLALLFTFSRGAWLALALASLLVGITTERRLLAAMVVLAAATFVIALLLPRHVFYPERGEERFDLVAATLGRLEAIGAGEDLRVQFVDNALPIVADHTLIGAGPGRYGGAVARNFGSPLYEDYTAGTVPVGRTVDNFWLHLLVEVGVLGTLAFLAAIGRAVWDAVLTARSSAGGHRLVAAGAAAAAIVLVVASLTEMLLEGNTTTFTMWLLLGIAGTGAGSVQNASR